jgi:hypothetical protein
LLPPDCSLPAPRKAAGLFRIVDRFGLRVDSRLLESLAPSIASRFGEPSAFGVRTMKRKRSIAAAILGRFGLELLPRWRLEHLAPSEFAPFAAPRGRTSALKGDGSGKFGGRGGTRLQAARRNG